MRLMDQKVALIKMSSGATVEGLHANLQGGIIYIHTTERIDLGDRILFKSHTDEYHLYTVLKLKYYEPSGIDFPARYKLNVCRA